MKIKHLWNVLFIVSISYYSTAQNKNWRKISENTIAQVERTDRSETPLSYSIFQFDIKDLSKSLQSAPLDLSSEKSTVITSFPTSENKTERFEIYQAPVMSAALSEKYPEIKSYIGKSLEDPTSIIRLSITPFGLQAVHYSESNGTNYIDTYTKDQKNYIYYNRNTLPEHQRINCLVDENTLSQDLNLIKSPNTQAKSSTPRVFREYRLAMACTIEYAKYHLDQAIANNIALPDEHAKKMVVLSAMVATMTRVNFIYERDLSIRMNLIDNNDDIIFIDTDDFSNNNPNQLIQQSRTVINKVIGIANFDIGHTVSTGGGGLAQLNAPCDQFTKAMGITGSPNPIGDPYDVDFVAHEMGHQFGAYHTFNSNCGGNIQPQTAVETGSGTSIMGYAGVCPPNVQQNSDPFFHSISIAQINDFIITSGDCSVNTAKSNSMITVNAGADYTIPKGTPFKLTGNSPTTQIENATYSWEQIDIQSSIQPPVSTATGGPTFRSFAPTTTPVRYFPKFENVLAETTTTWEVLPTVARNLNFNLIVRDNNLLLGGQTDIDQMEITVANVGPFLVTSPNVTNNEWKANSTQTVTWDVAGTTANGINSSMVNILFSADNGQTFTKLKENTPNDGSESITAPDYSSSECRILIEPIGNIYYAVSKKFKVVGGATASIEDHLGIDDFKIYPNPTNDVFTIQFESTSTNDISVQIHDLRGRLISNQSYKNSGAFQQEINLGNAQSGMYMVTVQDGNNKEVKKLIKR